MLSQTSISSRRQAAGFARSFFGSGRTTARTAAVRETPAGGEARTVEQKEQKDAT
ncbi:hypothetical protein DFW101_1999 [Solidesulfovibrio carbinoliphilus subsp. oakridgensis]|uniref:Uncharacterized protein n=1 Tax=Solidesulfovibrio carbinoliphilus subsp. oakridgensis TaxID=694327 RepID=G7Q6S0_9BACT|nr:hypothetical protein [Solidesulfovibrio carbinoliphilus]EHJ48005.1 hypothetical protein DFW101_1999 [Solidesulfovibrio carbinoliphilus subsp. oakridgensis]